MRHTLQLIIISLLALFLSCCRKETDNPLNEREFYSTDQFVMGADLSYLNEILDHGGVYHDSGSVADPYRIFHRYGTNVARFRLFNHPVWTKELYGNSGTQMYHDFEDVKRGISRAKSEGMEICLDFHYSDTWADPAHQVIPEAWQNLDLKTLYDSLYTFTFNTLIKLNNAGLMPDFVQTGNEINPGFLLPAGDRWAHTEDFVYLMNGAIKGVRDAAGQTGSHPKIILHIAQPENAITWMEGIQEAGLTDFDIIGISYYYIWSEVPLANISNYISVLTRDYGKEVMVMETAYPWTTANADSYGNIIDTTKLTAGYPATIEGQYDYLITLTQEIIDGGGKGIFYWEPGWITSPMITQWGTGSAWDCNTLFDFNGNPIKGLNFMTSSYNFSKK